MQKKKKLKIIPKVSNLIEKEKMSLRKNKLEIQGTQVSFTGNIHTIR